MFKDTSTCSLLLEDKIVYNIITQVLYQTILVKDNFVVVDFFLTFKTSCDTYTGVF
jgi:hypothetical protein